MSGLDVRRRGIDLCENNRGQPLTRDKQFNVNA